MRLQKFYVSLRVVLLLCGFQACQFVACMPGGESLITVAVYPMASLPPVTSGSRVAKLLDCLELANFDKFLRRKVPLWQFLKSIAVPEVTNFGNFWQHKITKLATLV